ncbi:DJ-1/PfpI family protein [Cyclonatronum proteinivorum]|nr:DJ-1/PfpI family protein [Cyclonatronum proteinivorum]
MSDNDKPWKPIRVAVLIYEGAEVLDYAGPFEVFYTAGRMSVRAGQYKPVFSPSLFGEIKGPIETRPGFTVSATCDFDSLPKPDVLIVPGGDHEPQLTNTKLLQKMRSLYAEGCLIASVCTGAFIVAESGLLNGKECTTHHEDAAGLQQRYPKIRVIPDKRIVAAACGRIFTSAGISAGIDLSLELVSRLADETLARETARNMAYRWEEINKDHHRK